MLENTHETNFPSSIPWVPCCDRIVPELLAGREGVPLDKSGMSWLNTVLPFGGQRCSRGPVAFPMLDTKNGTEVGA